MLTFFNILITKQTGIDFNIWLPFLWNKIEIYGPFVGNTIYTGILKSSHYYGYAFYTSIGLTAGLKLAEYGYNYKFYLNKYIKETPVIGSVMKASEKTKQLIGYNTTSVEYYPLFDKVMTFLYLDKLFYTEKDIVFKNRDVIRYKHREDILALKKEIDKLQNSVTDLQLIDRGVITGKQAFYNEISKLSILENLTPEVVSQTTIETAFYVPEESTVPCNHKIKKISFYGDVYKIPANGTCVYGLEVLYDVPTLYGTVLENTIIVYADWFHSQFETLFTILKDNPHFDFCILQKPVGFGLKGKRSIIDAEKCFLFNRNDRTTINIADYLTQRVLQKSAHTQFRLGREMDKFNKTLAKSLTNQTQDMNNFVYNEVVSNLEGRDIKSLKIATRNGMKDLNPVLNPLVVGAVTISGAVMKLAIVLQGSPVLENLDAINSLIQICPHLDVTVPHIFVKAKTLALEKAMQGTVQSTITETSTNISSIGSTMSSYISSNISSFLFSWKTLACVASVGLGIYGISKFGYDPVAVAKTVSPEIVDSDLSEFFKFKKLPK